jgi:hypothetical protein
VDKKGGTSDLRLMGLYADQKIIITLLISLSLSLTQNSTLFLSQPFFWKIIYIAKYSSVCSIYCISWSKKSKKKHCSIAFLRETIVRALTRFVHLNTISQNYKTRIFYIILETRKNVTKAQILWLLRTLSIRKNN